MSEFTGPWFFIRDADPRGFGHYMKHYSSRKARLGREHKRFGPNGRRYIGNGEHIALLTLNGLAHFSWRLQVFRKDSQTGVECNIFRNVGPCPSSWLIVEAVKVARAKWPSVRRGFSYCTATFSRGMKRLIRWGECFWHAGWELVEVKGLRFCWAVAL